MDISQTIRRMKELPEEKQQEVANFVKSLHLQVIGTRHRQLAEGHCPLGEDPAVGLWRDREEMSDSVEWVRRLRAEQWSRTQATR